MLSVKEKKQDTRPECHPKSIWVIRYNKNLGEITTFGMEMSTETTEQRFHLNFQGSDSYWLFVFPVHCKWKKLEKKFTRESYLATYFKGIHWKFHSTLDFWYSLTIWWVSYIRHYSREKCYIVCFIKNTALWWSITMQFEI